MLNFSRLLQETAELFGQYRTRSGDLLSFQKINSELNPNNKHGARVKDPVLIAFDNGPLNSKFGGRPYYSWQRDVISSLNSGNDVYVAALPGAGKTTPVMAHGIVDLLFKGENGNFGSSFSVTSLFNSNVNQGFINRWADLFCVLLTGFYRNRNYGSKTMFITPIRTLAFEQASDFEIFFLDALIFLRYLFVRAEELIGNPENFVKDPIGTLDTYINTNNQKAEVYLRILLEILKNIPTNLYNPLISTKTSDFEDWVLSHVDNNLICVKTGGGEGRYKAQPDKALAIIATYGSAENFVSKINNNVGLVVFDEALKECA